MILLEFQLVLMKVAMVLLLVLRVMTKVYQPLTKTKMTKIVIPAFDKIDGLTSLMKASFLLLSLVFYVKQNHFWDLKSRA